MLPVLSLAMLSQFFIWALVVAAIILIFRWLVGVAGLVIPQIVYVIGGIILAIVIISWLAGAIPLR